MRRMTGTNWMSNGLIGVVCWGLELDRYSISISETQYTQQPKSTFISALVSKTSFTAMSNNFSISALLGETRRTSEDNPRDERSENDPSEGEGGISSHETGRRYV